MGVHKDSSQSRRTFLKGLGIAAAGAALGRLLPFFGPARSAYADSGHTGGDRGLGDEGASENLAGNQGENGNRQGELPKRALGKTGFQVGLVSLGGEATVERADRRDEAVEIVNRAIDLGVNYIDTSPRYGNGASERNIGEVMRTRRDEVFLATKTHERTYDGTMRLVEESLERLKTDRLDLYQLHNIRLDSDLDQVFARDGAVRALERLKDESVVDHIGITGHRDPAVLLRGIREREFDTILMSLNAGDAYYKPFQEELLETALQKELGIIAMKVTAVDRIFREGGITSMEDALGYVLSLPVSTAIIGISNVRELEENARIARAFDLFSRDRMREVEELVAPYEREANFFKHYW